MRVRFEDEKDTVGIVKEDLTLVEYTGPAIWRDRIEETLKKIDSGTKVTIPEITTVDGEERMARLAELLPDLPFIHSAEVIEE